MRNLNDLAIFVKVVERGGFSAAAAQLQMSAALVSRRVRELEEDVGVQLINRSTRHLALTEAGEGFYRECAKALTALDEARTNAAGLSDQPRGILRIHAAVGVGQTLVVDAVTAFKTQYPDVGVDLQISTERISSLQRGYDVIVRTTEITESGLDSCEFGMVRHVIIASTDYLRHAGVPKEPADLANFDCLLLYGRRTPHEWRFVGPNGVYGVRVNGTFRSTTAAAVYAAAVKGLGIGRIPDYVLQGRADAAKLQILFDGALPRERSLKAYYARSRHLPAKVKAFLDCLQQVDDQARRVTHEPRKAAGAREQLPIRLGRL